MDAGPSRLEEQTQISRRPQVLRMSSIRSRVSGSVEGASGYGIIRVAGLSWSVGPLWTTVAAGGEVSVEGWHAYTQAAPWAVKEIRIRRYPFKRNLKHNSVGTDEAYSLTSSATMALPIGLVASVTMQTKP